MNGGALADWTYLAVRFGAIQASYAQGTLALAAGQVAFVPPQRPPVALPRDPGIGFTPPAVIPKLDEKKKLQATATTMATTPEQAKPAATGSSSATTQQGGKTAVGASDANSNDIGVTKEGSGSTTNSENKNAAQGTSGTTIGMAGSSSSEPAQQSPSSTSTGPSGVEYLAQ